MTREGVAYKVLGQCEESRQWRLSELTDEIRSQAPNKIRIAYLVAEIASLDIRQLRALAVLDKCEARVGRMAS